MDLQLVGKRALVTGSTAGIGLATAMGLYRERAPVCINGRTLQRVEQAIHQIKALPTIGTPEVTGVAADSCGHHGQQRWHLRAQAIRASI